MITVILVNWNGWADTIACMQSLFNAKWIPFRIVIVDNASPNDSVESLIKWSRRELELIVKNEDLFDHGDINKYISKGAKFDRHMKVVEYDESIREFIGLFPERECSLNNRCSIYLVRSAVNGGFGYGCNVGMELAKKLGTDAVWLLNNDCIVSPESLIKLYKCIIQNPRTIFGAVLKYYYQPDKIQAIGGGYMSKLTGVVKTFQKFPPLGELNFINGASMGFSKECMRELGGFDEKIFMYFEENDFCLRAEAFGFRFNVIDAEVFHKLGGSQGLLPTAKIWNAIYINKYYVLRKNLGLGLWLLPFFGAILLRAFLLAGNTQECKGARYALFYLLRNFLKGYSLR